VLGRSPRCDHDRRVGRGDTRCLGKGTCRGRGELEGVEADHDVERAMVERQLLHLTDDQLRCGQALPGDLDEPGRDVQPRNRRAPLLGKLEKQAGPASDVKQPRARSEPEFGQDGLIQSDRLRLLRREGGGPFAPQPALDCSRAELLLSGWS
jgi:hypothetical protein